MKQAFVFAGLLASICQSAYGLTFHDKIKSDVDGSLFTLLQGSEDEFSLKFDPAPSDGHDSWEFNTEGHPDDVAIIKVMGASSDTIACDPYTACRLSRGGEAQPFQITRIDPATPIFTFKDTRTGYYVKRSPDLYLRLSPAFDPTAVFTLAKIEGKDLPSWP